MATVIYPASLPKPLINITRSQSPGFQLKQPLAGPGYVKQLTTDSPATYELSWRMNREKALQFVAWFYGKSGLNRGFNRFTISLDTEFGPQDHTFQLTPDNLLPAAQEASNVFSYSATAICRKVPIPAVYTDHADLIVLDAYNYRAEIDVAMNQVWPESYPEPIVIPGTTSAFTSGLYYSNNNAVAFNDVVTFSRATTATYIDKDGVLKTAAINEPRFEIGGLLVEQQSTNLCPTGVMTDWGPSNVTTTSIGGFFYSAIENTQNASHNVGARTVSVESGSIYTFYIMAKPTGSGSKRWMALTASGSALSASHRATFDVDLGTFTVQNSPMSARMEKLGEYWLCEMQFQPISSGQITIGARLSDAAISSLQAWVGDGISGVICGCPQLEIGPSATSYIPTTGAAATRAADSASVLMQAHSAGTIFAEFLSESVAVDRIIYTAGDITMNRLATGAISVTAGAVTVTSAVVPSGIVKSAISYDGATLKLAVNGVVYSAVSVLPSAGTSLVLGASTFANVWQRSEAYDDDRLIEVTQ